MYERFTDKARKVMQLANEEAEQRHHDWLDTEHLLLAIVNDGSGVAAEVLKSLGIDLLQVRDMILPKLASRSIGVPAGKPPQTAAAKKAIEFSVDESQNLDHNYFGTEHILLGLLREMEGVAAQVLMSLGLALEDVREETLNTLGQTRCPACGLQLKYVLSHWRDPWWQWNLREAIEAGTAILGPGDDRRAPKSVCLACAPAWREVHDLAHEQYECQLAMGKANAEQDFDRAAALREKQVAIEPQLGALLDRMLGPQP